MNILRPPLLKALLKNRWPQFATMLIALSGFLLATVSGLFGTPVGSRNFGIVFVWIAWWAVLMLVAIPFLGRGWCSLCPIPAPGEWLQRGRLLGPEQFVRRTLSNRMIPRENQSRLNDFVLKVRSDAPQFSLNRRWLNRFRTIWLQNGAFLLVALFSTVILTQPRVTAIVLAAFLFVAVGASLVFERRAFCRYLCPVGTLSWLAYAASFLTLILLALPGVFWLAVWSGKRRSGSIQPTKKLFIAQAYALVPLGLAVGCPGAFAGQDHQGRDEDGHADVGRHIDRGTDLGIGQLSLHFSIRGGSLNEQKVRKPAQAAEKGFESVDPDDRRGCAVDRGCPVCRIWQQGRRYACRVCGSAGD